MTTAPFLNKSEATQLLHNLYDDFIEDNDLNDKHPNFQSLLHENCRNPNSTYGIKKGCQKGNQSKYGVIDRHRINHRPYFARSTLTAWFNSVYAPIQLKEAA